MDKRKRAESLGTVKYINKVGIELEGGWSERVGDVIRCRPRHLKSDGSVCVSLDGIGWVGEIASHPITPSAQVLGQWIRRNYPDKVNDTCGIHVHVSTLWENDYAKLINRDFQVCLFQFLKDFGEKHKLGTNHELWTRLKGGRSYCKPQWKGNSQFEGGSDDRYTAINFMAYKRHGTVEIRVLPAFRDAHMAVKGIYTVIRAVESFLSTVDNLGHFKTNFSFSSLVPEYIGAKVKDRITELPKQDNQPTHEIIDVGIINLPTIENGFFGFPETTTNNQ